MAQVIRKTRIEKTLKVVETEVTDGFSLELSEEEAQFLRDVLYHVGGSSTKSRRKHADNIIEALRSNGIDANGDGITGTIYFSDDPNVGVVLPLIDDDEEEFARPIVYDDDDDSLYDGYYEADTNPDCAIGEPGCRCAAERRQ